MICTKPQLSGWDKRIDIISQFLADIADRDRDRLAVAEVLRSAEGIAGFCAANAAAIDEEGCFPVEEFRRIKEAGLLSVALPCDRGGLGFGIEVGRSWPLLELLRQIGYGNLAVGRIYEGHLNAVQLVGLFGSPAQIRTCATDIREHQRLHGVWNTESVDGVKLLPLADGRYRLEGAKTFASGAGYIERPIVGAALPDGGWQMVIVPMEMVRTRTDTSWWQPLGMRASASFRVDFSGVELTDAALLGQPGDYYAQPWLTAGVSRFAAVQLGGAEALLDCARSHLRERGWGGDPYQRERMAKAAIACEGGRLWLQGSAAQLDRFLAGEGEAEGESLVAYANMVRTAIEGHCLEVMRLVEKSLGARCLIRPHPVERLVRDLTIYLRQPAPDAALAQLGAHVIAQEAPARNLWNDALH
ncbi:acyl-CoA dehydrogenase family protein [Gloeobacter kilaueensis]|uniref:Acyl-CoA dehydrogenase n=1 Tax=Gloeobacter kilaueensis (strain ATCC BAA-2537 / CCAP 1431/1 / ULC 316 / JS1) TaxID=1183438 RepID=U5QNU1_GLOK1|nr:acyl-CoA dehydrogenase family protein [Gloeobacter kilaueensis]AGY60606.1 acyl-CoA dehydrogenase [Gloeobacter kilaueensis JS1]